MQGRRLLDWQQAQTVPVIVLLVVLFMTFITEINSNTATASIFLPVLATMAAAGNTHPFLLMILATCSCAFMLPSGTGPNAVIFGSGQVTIPQMSRAGLRMNLISVVMLSVMMVLFVIPLLNISGTVPEWAILP